MSWSSRRSSRLSRSGRSCGRLLWRRRSRGRSSGRRWCWSRGSGRTHRRLGCNRTRRSRNLCRFSRRNYSWLCNNCRRCRRRSGSRRHGFCFHRSRWRRSGPDRRGHNRSRRRCSHGMRRRGWCSGSRGRSSRYSRLHARRSGSGFFRCLFRSRLLFRFRFRIGQSAEMFAHSYSGLYLNRAGMRFFLGNSGFGQIVDDGFCLDLEFASQFVDTDLIRIGHCPPGPLLVSALA